MQQACSHAITLLRVFCELTDTKKKECYYAIATWLAKAEGDPARGGASLLIFSYIPSDDPSPLGNVGLDVSEPYNWIDSQYNNVWAGE